MNNDNDGDNNNDNTDRQWCKRIALFFMFIAIVLIYKFITKKHNI